MRKIDVYKLKTKEKMNLCVKLIFLRRNTDTSFNIRVHSDVFFILVAYLI